MRQKTINLICVILIIIVGAYFIFGEILLPSDKLDQEAACAKYTGEWVRVMEDGTKEQISMPGKCVAARNEKIIVETVLPDQIENDYYLCFRSAKQDMKFYIDGQLKKEYSTEESRLFGRISAAAYLFVDINVEDAGRTLCVEMQTDSSYTGVFYTVYCGNPMGIWKYFFRQTGLELIVAFVVFILGVAAIIGSIAQWFCYRRRVALFYLGWGILISAVWLITNSTFRQLIFPNLSVVNDITFLMIMLLPLPYLLYMNEVQKNRYGGIYQILESIVIINFFLCSFLHITKICDFTDTISYTSLSCIISIILVIVTICLDMKKGTIREYTFVAIGMFGICVTAFVQILLYFNRNEFFNGVILALGLIFLLGFSTISTIHEIMDIEGEKQQALLASESKGRFLANMSHEIRTPIHAVLGMDAMILRESSEAPIREYALDIKNAGQTLLALINDILDISKIESGKLEILPVEYDISSLIYDVMNMMKMRAKDKGLELNLLIDQKIPSELWGDDVRIRQILVNLMNNAIKYTKTGSVTLSVQAQIKGDMAVLTFRVEDTGIGIREEDIEKLFQAFERLEEQRNRSIEGTGLGMNITAKLLELMGSRLQVESVYGEGSVFSFMLEQKIINKEPIGNLEERIKNQMTIYSYEPLFTAPGVHVLIVDDNAVNRRVFVQLLKATQIRIDEASGGKECLELVKQQTYDLIFLDHMMPDMDGITVLHHMQAMTEYPCQGMPVIALTANAVTGAKEMYLQEGFTNFLSKPINPEKLEKMILDILPDEKIVRRGGETGLEYTVAKKQEKELPLPELEGIDWKYAGLYCPDTEILKDTLQQFSQMLEAEAEKLEEFLLRINKDPEQAESLRLFRVQVHSMKNSASMIGAVSLAGVARILEYAARDEKISQIQNITPVFLQEWRRLKEILKPVVQGEKQEEATKALDSKLIGELLHMLIHAMEEMDVDTADEIIEQLKQFDYQEDIIKETVDVLCLAVINLDEEKTTELARQLAQQLKIGGDIT